MTLAEALRAIEGLERIHGYKIDAILPDGTHRYWSTHCRHGRHEDCSAATLTGRDVNDRSWGATIARRPAQCKNPDCQAPCICPCHKEVSSG